MRFVGRPGRTLGEEEGGGGGARADGGESRRPCPTNNWGVAISIERVPGHRQY